MLCLVTEKILRLRQRTLVLEKLTNLFSWELILFLFFFFIYMLLVFWQKRKWSELDKLNKDQEVKFVTYVNGMYFFGFILSVFYLSLSLLVPILKNCFFFMIFFLVSN